MGIQGEIIPIASHSNDSIAVILDQGICCVGDLDPIAYMDAYEGNTVLQEDWDLVLSYHPELVYYGHANEQTGIRKDGEKQ